MKWIAIKDQLPPEAQDVLLWDSKPIIGWLRHDGDFEDYELRIGIPTHWAEITPPEIGETK